MGMGDGYPRRGRGVKACNDVGEKGRERLIEDLTDLVRPMMRPADDHSLRVELGLRGGLSDIGHRPQDEPRVVRNGVPRSHSQEGDTVACDHVERTGKLTERLASSVI